MTKLFADFQETSAKAWKQKIQVDLKGADYNDTLIWNSPEGVTVKPFYHADESVNIGISTNSANWKIGQKIYVLDEKLANKKAKQAIVKGAESIHFIIDREPISFTALLESIDPNEVDIHFYPIILSDALINALAKVRGNCYLHLDIIGNLAREGNWYFNLKKDHELLEYAVSQLGSFKTSLSVDISLYQNAGANMVQQLAYGLAHANEYLNHFEKYRNEAVAFNVAIGNNYFFEIAKLKALRMLWKTLAKNYNIISDCHIVATPTKRNKTIYDYNTNMLRTTTECMSAILGGANTVVNLPYDAIYHKDNEFGERIARNQLLILKQESYFNKVNNPTEGSYYIDSLSRDLSEKALDLFKDIERNGGFLNQLKEGTLQRKLKESFDKEQQLFNDEEEVLVGTNKYLNGNDKMKHDLELYPFVKTNKRKTLIEPIIEKRLAETIEQERLNTE